MNKKAQIVLREGTGAMKEYGKAFWGYIRDLAEVYHKEVKEMFKDPCEAKILLIVDEFGEKALIPCEDIENITYV